MLPLCSQVCIITAIFTVKSNVSYFIRYYCDWTLFRDYYKSLFVSVASISDIVSLHMHVA